MPGEQAFIEWIRKQSAAGPGVVVPPGDDLAAVRWSGDDLLLIGMDQVLDGVHFDSSIHSPRAIGAKAMNRNLSDCAAMACLPVAAVVSAALPVGVGLDYAREIHAGLAEAAAPFDCSIVGGDTGSWPGKLALSVAILGRSAGISPILRSGAKPGDRIYVSGKLGGSIFGRHMTFTPRVALARELAGTGAVTAMIDLSDGLARDLAHIARESGIGAILQADQIPIHDDVAKLADGESPLHHALGDGEDYELLFTAATTLHQPGLFEIGRVTQEPGIRLQTAGGIAPLAAAGWEHAL